MHYLALWAVCLNFIFGLPFLNSENYLQRSQRTSSSKDAGVELPPPPGMSSLSFVFDRTGSMNDDLNQVFK